MSRISIIVGFSTLIAFGVGLGYLGWKMLFESPGKACHVCQRPIHSATKTTALVDNERQVFCCPTCALNFWLQSDKEVEILEFTDSVSGAVLPSTDAFIVEGSSYNSCMEHTMLTDQVKQTFPINFDRCSPSIIAFASREAANRFSMGKGGTTIRFEELLASRGR